MYRPESIEHSDEPTHSTETDSRNEEDNGHHSDSSSSDAL